MAVSAGHSGPRRPLYMPQSAPGRHIWCCPPHYCVEAPSKSSGASPAPPVWEIGVAVLPSIALGTRPDPGAGIFLPCTRASLRPDLLAVQQYIPHYLVPSTLDMVLRWPC